MVVDVAPPHAPVGAALAAFFRLPVVTVQVFEGTRFAAPAQVACAYVSKEIETVINNNIPVTSRVWILSMGFMFWILGFARIMAFNGQI